MKRLVTDGVVVAAIIVASGCTYFRGRMGSESTGKSELRQSFEAKKAARSYRMKMSQAMIQNMTAGAKLETEVEVACPDRERIVSRLGLRTFETIRIAGDAFLLNPDGRWDKLSLPPRSIPCGGNPGAPAAFALMNEGRDLSAVVGDMLNDSRWIADITRAPALMSAAMPARSGRCRSIRQRGARPQVTRAVKSPPYALEPQTICRASSLPATEPQSSLTLIGTRR